MSTVEPNETIHQVPALLTFRSNTSLVKGILAVRKELEILFYFGAGRSKKLVLKDVPPQLGMPLIQTMYLVKKFMEEDLEEPAVFTHKCPGKLDGGADCENETFEVTVDKRVDGLFLLRLDCAKCKATIIQDMRMLEKKPATDLEIEEIGE